MASDLLSIAASGARASRAALDVTAQNIANAASDGYVRRSASMAEVSSSGGLLRSGDISLSGVRIAGITRNADAFRQVEVRRTNSDVTRGATELRGLEYLESAIEQVGVYNAVVGFEAALQQLAVDPIDPSLRASFLAAADAMAQKFSIADSSMEAAATGLQFEAEAAAAQANTITQELARVNLRLSRAGNGSSDQATLLDQRDQLLENLSGIANISTSFAADGSATVHYSGAGGPVAVSGGAASVLSVTVAANGTLSFDVDGDAVALSGGSLAGTALALSKADQLRQDLHGIAASLIAAANTAQTNGVDVNGNPGQALFSGTNASDMRLAFTDGALLATASAGQPAGSRDAGALTALRQALASDQPAQKTSNLLFDVSSAIATRKLTQEALDAIAGSARIALQQQAGVDLDTEAANLIRFQQAFQASGRAMQVAVDLFDTLLGIRG